MRIGFHNHLPAPSPMTRYNHPPPWNDIPTVESCRFKHISKIDLCKPPILHPFQKVWTEFEFPIPPQRPLTRNQSYSLLKSVAAASSVTILLSSDNRVQRCARRSRVARPPRRGARRLCSWWCYVDAEGRTI